MRATTEWMICAQPRCEILSPTVGSIGVLLGILTGQQWAGAVRDHLVSRRGPAAGTAIPLAG